MKLLLIGLFFIAAPANAAGFQYLYCTRTDMLSGTTTIAYSGTVNGVSYLNVSNVSFLAPPFVQQAAILYSVAEGKRITIHLRSMVTGLETFLQLTDGSPVGYLLGKNGERTEFRCSANL